VLVTWHKRKVKQKKILQHTHENIALKLLVF